MNLGPYADLHFKDKDGFDDFLLSLEINHRRIAQKMGTLGVVYPTYPLADAKGSRKDWQQSLQSELQSIYRGLNFDGLPDLSGSDLDRQDDFEAFMQLVVYSEMRVNSALGIL